MVYFFTNILKLIKGCKRVYGRNRSQEKPFIFRRSAEQGYAPAIYYLGRCYLNGYGVTANRRSAIECFREAAEAGNSSAKAELLLLEPN